MGRGRDADGLGALDRRAAVCRPSSQARQDAAARTDRATRRPRHPVPRTERARRMGHRVPDRCRLGRGDRHRRGRRMRDRGLRHDLSRRFDEPTIGRQGHAVPRDHPPEPAAVDQPQRIRRRRPAAPGRHLHPRRRGLPQPDPGVEARDPHDHGRVRPQHRRRCLHPGHERLHDLRQRARHGLSRWAAAGEDGDRRGRRRGDARWGGDAQPHQRAQRLSRRRRDGRPANGARHRQTSALEETRSRALRTGRRTGPRRRTS